MSTAGKLAAFAVALVLVAGGGWAIGSAAGPFAEPAEAEHAEEAGNADAGGHSGADADTEAGHGDGGHGEGEAATEPAGLASTQDGYTFLATGPTVFQPGVRTPFSFQITGPGGAPVTEFDIEHDKRMHLILVRRDTAGFQHVHPELSEDGTWTVPLTLTLPGSYRAFADFAPTGGEALTLGLDLAVPGDFRPVDPPPSREATVDGYQVRLDGALVPGEVTTVTLTVHKDGKPVTDLQPYLGVYGHLVALRTGDLGYLHVHPVGTPGDGATPPGPSIEFGVEVPTAGDYRLFLDFRHDDTVRTAEFTVRGGAK